MEAKERNEIYKRALAIYEKLKIDDYYFICNVLDNVYKDIHNTIFINVRMNELEEFSLFAPSEEDWLERNAWFCVCNGFDGNYTGNEIKNAQRMILEFCIEMSNQKTKP